MLSIRPTMPALPASIGVLLLMFGWCHACLSVRYLSEIFFDGPVKGPLINYLFEIFFSTCISSKYSMVKLIGPLVFYILEFFFSGPVTLRESIRLPIRIIMNYHRTETLLTETLQI